MHRKVTYLRVCLRCEGRYLSSSGNTTASSSHKLVHAIPCLAAWTAHPNMGSGQLITFAEGIYTNPELFVDMKRLSWDMTGLSLATLSTMFSSWGITTFPMQLRQYWLLQLVAQCTDIHILQLVKPLLQVILWDHNDIASAWYQAGCY